MYERFVSDPMTEYEKIVSRENAQLRIEVNDLRKRLKQAEIDRDNNAELADRYQTQRDDYFHRLIDSQTKCAKYRNSVEKYLREIQKILKG